MKRIIILSFSFFLFWVCSDAQTLKAYEKAGWEAYEQKNFFAAIKHFNVVLDVQSNRADILFAYAESARQFGAYKIAEEGYEKLASSGYKQDFPMTDFWLGTVKKYLGKYNEAKAAFQRFLAETAPNDYFYKRTYQEIRSCDWSLFIVENPNEDIDIIHLDTRINSPFSEFSPVRINDTLYFSALRYDDPSADPKDEEYHPLISKLMMAEPGASPEVIDAPFNFDNLNVANLAFNRDQSRLYYTLCGFTSTVDLLCQIYYSDRLPGGSWSEPIRLPDFVNQPGTTSTQPNIGYDNLTGKEILFFVSDREGGKGKLDIWYSYIEPNGEVTEAVNLSAVNTLEDEASPFFHETSQVLYFSSNGYKGLGGFDILKSVKNGPEWYPAEHLGYPLNSSYNDVYYSLDPTSSKGIFSSNREGSVYLEETMESCCNDLYEVSFEQVLVDLELSVYDRKSNVPLEGTTTYVENTTDGTSITQFNQDSYQLRMPLDRDKNYQIISRRPGYISDTIYLNTGGVIASKTFEEEAFLEPVDLELLVVTFDDVTKKPLNGVRLELTDWERTDSDWQRNFDGNKFYFDVDPGKDYQIIASKEGYFSDTIPLRIGEALEKSGRITKHVYLEMKPSNIATMSEFLPLPFYFDNDQPDQGFVQAGSELNYEDVFREYYGRKELFMEKYSSSLEGEHKFLAMRDVDNFFEEEVRLGYESLKGILAHLLIYLSEGEKVDLVIKGYASPRADQSYNYELTKRRTTCLKNHIKSYKNGALMPFLDSGQLSILERPFGESKAPSHVSDDLDDERNSIYSIDASKERRVEILEILDASDLD